MSDLFAGLLLFAPGALLFVFTWSSLYIYAGRLLLRGNEVKTPIVAGVGIATCLILFAMCFAAIIVYAISYGLEHAGVLAFLLAVQLVFFPLFALALWLTRTRSPGLQWGLTAMAFATSAQGVLIMVAVALS